MKIIQESLLFKLRWILLTIAVVALFGAFNGMGKLKVNEDFRVFLGDENPQLMAYEEFENTYNKETNLLIVINTSNESVFNEVDLKLLKELTDLSWKIPYSSRVESISNFQHSIVNNDLISVVEIFDLLKSSDNKALEDIKNIVLTEPTLQGRLINKEGDVSSILITINNENEKEGSLTKIVEHAKKLIGEFQDKHSHIEFMLSGSVMYDEAFKQSSLSDLTSLVPLMYLVVLVLTGLLTRSFVSTFSTMVVVILSTIFTMGLAGYIGIDITSVSANAPTIILTIAVADCLHILTSYTSHIRSGLSKKDSVIQSITENLTPVIVTSLTTALGFLSMNFSDAPPFRDLGNLVAIGVILAMVLSLTILPAMLFVLPSWIKKGKKEDKLQKLGEFIVANRKYVLPLSVVMCITFAFGMHKITLDDNFTEYFDKSTDIRRTGDFIQDKLTGLDTIEYTLDSGAAGEIITPEYLNSIEEFAKWYRQQENVAHVTVFSDVIKRLNKTFNQDKEEYHKIPQEKETISQLFLMYELSLPFGMGMNNQVNFDKSSTRMTVRLSNASSADIRELDDKARAWLKNNSDENLYTYGTGLSVIFSHISQRNIERMLSGTIVTILLVSLLLLFVFRSIKYFSLSLTANLLPALIAFGIWGYFIGDVGLAVAVVGTMTLGIVVDDTIHFIYRYRDSRTNKLLDPHSSIIRSFIEAGKPMLFTTLSLICGFLLLAMSSFKLNSDLGILGSISFLFALIIDFTLLPCLLMYFEDEKSEESEIENTGQAQN